MTASSPCIRTCVLDDRTGHCLGCGRSLQEIAAWASLGEAQRRGIMAELPARLAAAQARTAGGGPPPVRRDGP